MEVQRRRQVCGGTEEGGRHVEVYSREGGMWRYRGGREVCGGTKEAGRYVEVQSREVQRREACGGTEEGGRHVDVQRRSEACGGTEEGGRYVEVQRREGSTRKLLAARSACRYLAAIESRTCSVRAPSDPGVLRSVRWKEDQG